MTVWQVRVPAPAQWLTANVDHHRYRRAALVRQWRAATVWACTAAKLPKGVTPVRIHALVQHAGRAPVRDRLNLAPTIKALVDGLSPSRSFVRAGVTHYTVGYGLLPDDSDAHVLDTTWQLERAVDGRAAVVLTVTHCPQPVG